MPKIGTVKRQVGSRSRKTTLDPATVAAMGRVEQALGYRGWLKEPVLEWKELAAAAGVSATRMSEIRKGERRLQLSEAIHLARRLEVRVGWLVAEEGPMRDEGAAATAPTLAVAEGTSEFYSARGRQLHASHDTRPAKPASGRPAKRGKKGG